MIYKGICAMYLLSSINMFTTFKMIKDLFNRLTISGERTFGREILEISNNHV